MKIEKKILAQVLEYVAAEKDDYSDLEAMVPEYQQYLRYAKDKGMIEWDGKFNGKNPINVVEAVKGGFSFSKKIRIKATGLDYWNEAKKSTISRFKDSFQEQMPTWFAKTVLAGIGYVFGVASTLIFQKYFLEWFGPGK